LVTSLLYSPLHRSPSFPLTNRSKSEYGSVLMSLNSNVSDLGMTTYAGSAGGHLILLIIFHLNSLKKDVGGLVSEDSLCGLAARRQCKSSGCEIQRVRFFSSVKRHSRSRASEVCA
jgi:hypothetical protein